MRRLACLALAGGALAALALRHVSATGQPSSGLVVSVHDGDTITVETDGKRERVRLLGIDARVSAYTAGFVGSRKSDVYHYPSCSSAKTISPGNLRTFATPANARAAGCRPCKRCSPR